jgi:hypothetical protein
MTQLPVLPRCPVISQLTLPLSEADVPLMPTVRHTTSLLGHLLVKADLIVRFLTLETRLFDPLEPGVASLLNSRCAPGRRLTDSQVQDMSCVPCNGGHIFRLHERSVPNCTVSLPSEAHPLSSVCRLSVDWLQPRLARDLIPSCECQCRVAECGHSSEEGGRSIMPQKCVASAPCAPERKSELTIV